jgi:hypothetical protein
MDITIGQSTFMHEQNQLRWTLLHVLAFISPTIASVLSCWIICWIIKSLASTSYGPSAMSSIIQSLPAFLSWLTQALKFLWTPILKYQLSLLQNMSVVSTGKNKSIPFIRYEKGDIFSIGCCQLIQKIIIGIDWLKTTDTNKLPGRYPRYYWYRLA